MSKWERGSRKTAALLAAWAITSGNSALTAPATASKRSSCSSKKAESGSSAVAKWVQTPASSRLGSAAQARARASTSSGSGLPSRPMPLSCLTWTRAGRPWARARAASRRAEVLAPDRHLGAGGERGVDLLGGQRAHRQQRDVLEAAADLLGLARGRDREPRGAAGQRRGRRSRRRRGRSRRP